MYDNLINRLQEHVEWAKANEWEVPLDLADCLTEAIHAIGTLVALAQNGQSAIDTNVRLVEEIERIQAKTSQEQPNTPCDLCAYDPPSSLDGKPCTMCPAMSRRD